MKLPFFNVKIAHRSNGDAFNATRISIVEKLEKQLPLPEGLLSIHFTFSSNDLTHAEAFANCLKSMNIQVLYPIVATSCKQLICKTLKLNADVENVKQVLFTVLKEALKYGYNLDQWRIESDRLAPWYGGLVVKAAGIPAENSL